MWVAFLENFIKNHTISIGYFVLFIANKTPTYYQMPPKHHSTVSHRHKKAQLPLREQSLSFLTCFSSATEVLSSSDIMWSRHLTWSMLFQPALRGPKKIHSFFIGIAEVKSLEEMSHMVLEADNVCESLGFSLFHAFQTDFWTILSAGCTVTPAGGNRLQVFEWIIESFSESICTNTLIQSESKQMNESLNHLLKRFGRKHWLIQEWNAITVCYCVLLERMILLWFHLELFFWRSKYKQRTWNIVSKMSII